MVFSIVGNKYKDSVRNLILYVVSSQSDCYTGTEVIKTIALSYYGELSIMYEGHLPE